MSKCFTTFTAAKIVSIKKVENYKKPKYLRINILNFYWISTFIETRCMVYDLEYFKQT